MNLTRRVRNAAARITPVCFPDGVTIGYYVTGWRPGRPDHGPFLDHEDALEAALGDTASLVDGAARRHGGL